MLPQATVNHYRAQQRLELAARAATTRLWRDMGSEFDVGWSRVGPRLVLLVGGAQLAAAAAGADYVAAVLEETGQAADPVGEVDPQALAGVASDGRPLDGLLYGAVTTAKEASGNGADAPTALEQGRKALDLYVLTQVADAARVAAGIGIAARPRLSGWVRMVNPPCCARCAVLAGKHFKWNQGFPRHPRCDCRHIPAGEDRAGDLATDPQLLAERGGIKDLTKAEQSALAEGADLGQVVNARRGRYLDVAGHRLTSEGMTRRGLAGRRLGGSTRGIRPTPEEIYRTAGNERDEAIRLLQRFGYLI